MKKFSVIIPIKDEKENIPIISQKIKKLKFKYNYEIIFVDDGSTDESWDVIKNLNKKDKKIKGLSFSKNFGHQMALTAGIDYCNSDFLIMMDGDLQHPPEYINKMIKEYEKGYDIVQMVKKNQGNRSLIQKLAHQYFIISFLKYLM